MATVKGKRPTGSVVDRSRRRPLIEVAPATAGLEFVSEAEFSEGDGKAQLLSALHAREQRNLLVLELPEESGQDLVLTHRRRHGGIGHVLSLIHI